MEKNIEKKEKIGEIEFETLAPKLNINKYKFTPANCSYDVKLQYNDFNYIGEIKVRQDKTMAYFEENGPYLEHKKLSGMIDERNKILKEKNIRVRLLYVNITSNGYMLYELNNEIYQYKNCTYEYLPKNNYSKEMEYKLVTKLQHPLIMIEK